MEGVWDVCVWCDKVLVVYVCTHIAYHVIHSAYICIIVLVVIYRACPTSRENCSQVCKSWNYASVPQAVLQWCVGPLVGATGFLACLVQELVTRGAAGTPLGNCEPVYCYL